jgi:DNA repair exonuclease SbcCD ATPase subunit
VKIVSLATRNFRSLPDREWKFDAKFHVVKGPNETGKSSIVDAILTALYGDATSSDKKYEAYRRWKSNEGICVTLDLVLKAGAIKLERDFESGKNRYTFEGKTVQAKDKIRQFLAEHLPIAAEESFRQTACVRQDEIKRSIDSSQLKRQLESSSLSSTGHDLTNLEKELDSHNNELRRGLFTAAPKNPGPIKVIEDDLQELREELGEREAKEREAGSALAEFETVDAQLERLAEQQRRGEERQDLDRKYVEAETIYKQRESEIGDLTGKKAKLQQLPQVILSAQQDTERAEQSVREKTARRTQALEWRAKNISLKSAQERLAKLAFDVQKLESLAVQSRALTDPLSALNFEPADFERFHALERELGKMLREVGEIREKELRLAKESEKEKARSTSLEEQQTALEEVIAKLQAELALAKQAREAEDKHQNLLAQHRTVSQRVGQIAALDLDLSRYSQELAAQRAVVEIDQKGFEDTVASAQALETAIQAEGIGLEIEPEQSVQITVQMDNGSKAGVVLSATQKFTARSAILVHVPGVGRLRITNESSTAQQLDQKRRQIAGALSQASVSGIEDLLERFRQHDELTAQVNRIGTKLQVLLDARAKEDWEQDECRLAEELRGVSGELKIPGSIREILVVAQDLSGSQGQLDDLKREHIEAVTRSKMLAQSLTETQKTLQDRGEMLVGIQREVEIFLQRANQKDVASLQGLEAQFNEYVRLGTQIQTEKAKVLEGRLESDVRSWFDAVRQDVAEQTEQLEGLGTYALDDNELVKLENEVAALNGALSRSRNHVAGLLKEKELLEAEKLDDKYVKAVTQAAVADQNMKQYGPYAFATPGERLGFREEIKALASEVEKARNRRAEVKVKSDFVGHNQDRISELKETIAESERRITRLKHQLDIDGAVLRYLQQARTKALADLLDSIPIGVGNLMNRITVGRYQRVDGNGFDLRVWSDQKGETLELQEMSSGTIDQFYLSLRLEALRSIFIEDVPPLILDDPLVSCDPLRRSRIIEILDKHSEFGQVIYLTCHHWPELDVYPCVELS